MDYKIKQLFISPVADDFFRKLFVMLTVFYVIFFGAESVLPGLIIEVFNFNWVLLGWLASLGYLLFSRPLNSDLEKDSLGVKNIWTKLFLFFLAFFLAWVFFMVLYKVSLLERLIYFVLVLVLMKYLIDRLK